MSEAVPLVLTKKEQAARKKFLAERATCVGGSDIQHLLGLEFGCERRLFYDKAQIPADFPESVNSHMRRGILLEAVAIREYSAATGRKIIHRGLFVRHPKHSFMGVHLDGVLRPAKGVPAGTLECKIPTFRAFRSYNQTQEAPPGYVLQAHYNAMVAGFSWSSITIFNPDQMKTLWFDQQRDEAIVKSLPDIVAAFWSKVQAYWKGQLKENPFPKLDRTDRRCGKCPWRGTCQQLGETAQIILDADCDEIKGVDFVRDEDDELAAKALEFFDLNKKANALGGLAKKAKEEVADLLGDRKAVEVPEKVKIWWKEGVRNEKAREARKTRTFSLKVLPTSQTNEGVPDGEEASNQAGDDDA